MRYPEIPNYILRAGICSEVVDYYDRSSKNPNSLEDRINPLLPDGWRFESLRITERDSFGPVTTLLSLIHDNGTVYKTLI